MEEILSAYFVTERNITTLETLNRQNVKASVYGGSTELKVGMVLIVQTIVARDLFEGLFDNTHHNVWIATRELFDMKFIIGDEVKEDNFAVIYRRD